MNRVALLSLCVLAAGTLAVAAPSTVSVDETGNGSVNGTPTAGILQPDPGPGGAIGLTYPLPFTTVPGDVLINEGAAGPSDVLRFNGNTLVVYSDNVDGSESLADVLAPPSLFYGNLVQFPEAGSETDNGLIYTPGPADPGFTAGGVTYTFISDGVGPPVPDGGVTAGLLGAGLLALGLLRRVAK